MLFLATQAEHSYIKFESRTLAWVRYGLVLVSSSQDESRRAILNLLDFFHIPIPLSILILLSSCVQP